MKTTISFLKLILWSFVFYLGVFLIFHILHKLFPEIIQSYKDLSPTNKDNAFNIKPWRFFLDACVIAPLVEESVFRLNLSKEIKNHYFSLGIAILFFLLTLLNSDYYNGYIFFIYSFFVLVVYKITKKDFPINTMLIASSIVFSLVHVSKLDSNLVWNPISYLVYTSPLMVLGYYFGLIRIRHGILLAMVAHFLKNFFAYYLLFV